MTKNGDHPNSLDPSEISRKEPVYVGDALLGYREKSAKKKSKFPFDRRLQQLRELERIIKYRHGLTIPKTDDAVIYAEVAAIMHLIIDREGIENSFPAWCRRWMPWADKKLIERLLYDDLKQHHHMPSDDALGHMLHLSYEERCELDIRAIGCHDVTRAGRAKLQAQKRRGNDRARKQLKRRAEGMKPRSEYEASSASREKPWREQGISRTTWYRRKRCNQSNV